MQQTSELQKVKDRIRALVSKTADRGCSEHEVLAAMTMVGTLLERFNLTMDEVSIREEKCHTVRFDTGSKNRSPLDKCVVALADFCGCKVWFSRRRRGGGTSAYGLFGTTTDTELALYLLDLIKRAIDTETAAFKRTPAYRDSFDRRDASRSFALGMASRLSNRFTEMQGQREAEVARREAEQQAEMAAARADINFSDTATFGISTARGQAASIGALVVLKGQLVEQEFAKSGVKLKTNYSRTRAAGDGNAYRAGRDAGDRVNLSRPIGGGINQKLLG